MKTTIVRSTYNLKSVETYEGETETKELFRQRIIP